MAEVDKLKSEVASISERFERLESLVEKFSEQRSVSQSFRQAQAKDGECGNVGCRQVAADEEQHQLMPSAVLESSASCRLNVRQFETAWFETKVKLPPDLVVGDSRAGVSRADLPKFHVIQKSARYYETVLKLLSSCDPGDTAVAQISSVSLAHLRFLQEEYRQLLVSSQFDDGTTKLSSTLQQNPAAFT